MTATVPCFMCRKEMPVNEAPICPVWPAEKVPVVGIPPLAEKIGTVRMCKDCHGRLAGIFRLIDYPDVTILVVKRGVE